MSKLELIDNIYSPEVIEDFIPPTEWTTSKYSDELVTLGRTSMVAIALSGGCVLSANSNNFIPQNKKYKVTLIQNSVEKSLESYKDIFSPFDSYIKEIVANRNYEKHEIVKGILSFKSLTNNWDGYGSIPLEIESATNALTLVDLIGEKCYSNMQDFYPNPNGTITFLWENYLNEKVSVEIGNTSMSYFVRLSAQKVQFYNKKEINVKESSKLSKIINSL